MKIFQFIFAFWACSKCNLSAFDYFNLRLKSSKYMDRAGENFGHMRGGGGGGGGGGILLQFVLKIIKIHG